MRRTSQKEIGAVLKLDGPARYKYFVKRVADEEMAWGLWKGDRARMADFEGKQVLPIWPAREYAELCRTEEWGATSQKNFLFRCC